MCWRQRAMSLSAPSGQTSTQFNINLKEIKMRSLKRVGACLAIGVAMCSITAEGYAFDTPSQMPAKRRQLFEILQFTPAFKDHGIANALALQAAMNNLKI